MVSNFVKSNEEPCEEGRQKENKTNSYLFSHIALLVILTDSSWTFVG